MKTFLVISLVLLYAKNMDAVSQPIGFTACNTNGGTLGDHQTLDYDHVVSNAGGGFDTIHSHFTAPVTGLYHFSATVMAKDDTEIHVHIVKNGAELVKVYSAFASFESGSNEVYVHLQMNDSVWVQNMDTGAKLEAGLWNCFSGALVHADD